MERQKLNPLVLIMIEENKMKDNKTRPVDSYAHVDFMEIRLQQPQGFL